ncbi:polysaccharide deacetylase family protein [Anaerosacchariphilus polymeriproducens]|uniref:Deacetylase PdaC domain-containing protein n=1 Tax=Anaerosacchariphilus polymeriproducens TaxID=1812858 RepID=A0A371AW80_9FIRM|nr:hypothetical protein [Anaerosacchariphilus polymeriproducens]RDU23827.1 hypothetical protein DWV06_08190 [Anaerosacchariphilus polymeriproducens]
MRKRNIITLIVILTLTCSLAACKQNKPTTTTPTQTQETTTEPEQTKENADKAKPEQTKENADKAVPEKEMNDENSKKQTEQQETQTETTEKTYELKSETFKENEVIIEYPQLTNYTDADAQEKINGIIKENALRYKQTFAGEGDPVTYELKYEAMKQDSDFLSIRFLGYVSYQQSLHPNNFIYTLNIDLKKQLVIKLSDLLTINQDLADSLKQGKYIGPHEEQSPELLEYVKSELNATDNEGWIQNLTNADSTDVNKDIDYFSYWTNNGVVITIPVSHASGDYAEIEIPYNNLTNLKTDHVLWNTITK